MPIVIDEFQVDAAAPQQQRRGGGGDEAAGGNGEGGGGKQPDAEEFERACRAQAERAERVWAH
jgi:hypothetical protein